MGVQTVQKRLPSASGLRRQPMSRRLVPPTSEHHHSTHPRSRRAGPRQKNARISIQYTRTCNLARPPVHHRPPFRSCRVCSRPCHVLPSCTRNSPSRAACVWHGDSAVSSAWDAINIENIHAQLAGRLAGDPFAQRTQLLRWLLTLPDFWPAQPASRGASRKPEPGPL